MSSSRKVVVIGAGPAGYVCAIRLAQLGVEVTVIEKDELGGTCLNVGCIPSKAMIAAGALMERIVHAGQMGIHAQGVSLEIGELVKWKAGVVAKLTGGVAGLLKSNGAKSVKGKARIVDKNTVEVSGTAGKQTLRADDIVIATGSVPIEIPGFAFDEDAVWSSTGALAPKRVPEHLVVIGGGYIGSARHDVPKPGSRVTVIEATGGVLLVRSAIVRR
jgi:dihydrolipoamide dehydrogenase